MGHARTPVPGAVTGPLSWSNPGPRGPRREEEESHRPKVTEMATEARSVPPVRVPQRLQSVFLSACVCARLVPDHTPRHANAGERRECSPQAHSVEQHSFLTQAGPFQPWCPPSERPGSRAPAGGDQVVPSPGRSREQNLRGKRRAHTQAQRVPGAR